MQSATLEKSTVGMTIKTLSEEITEKMQKLGWNTRDLSDRVGLTYEYVRTIVRGDKLPSKNALKEICRQLELNYDRCISLLNLQKIDSNPSDLISVLPDQLRDIAQMWDGLTPEQQLYLCEQAKDFAQRNVAK